MLFILALIFIGLLKRQGRRYWRFAVAAVLLQMVLGTLLYGGGTLANPAADGLVTRWVRAVTQDGPVMGLWALFVIALAWGVPIWIVIQGYERKDVGDEESAADSGASPATSPGAS